jgi:hypothetical protein
VLLAAALSGPPAARGQAAKPADAACPEGPDGRREIAFRKHGGRCVVVEPVAAVCVERGRRIHWTLTNRDCDWKAGAPAVVLSSPRPKGGQKRGFTYADCVPKRDAWPARTSVSLVCAVPADTEAGLYKYDVSGQVKTLDPDIEVRKGGG